MWGPTSNLPHPFKQSSQEVPRRSKVAEHGAGAVPWHCQSSTVDGKQGKRDAVPPKSTQQWEQDSCTEGRRTNQVPVVTQLGCQGSPCSTCCFWPFVPSLQPCWATARLFCSSHSSSRGKAQPDPKGAEVHCPYLLCCQRSSSSPAAAEPLPV